MVNPQMGLDAFAAIAQKQGAVLVAVVKWKPLLETRGVSTFVKDAAPNALVAKLSGDGGDGAEESELVKKLRVVDEGQRPAMLKDAIKMLVMEVLGLEDISTVGNKTPYNELGAPQGITSYFAYKALNNTEHMQSVLII